MKQARQAKMVELIGQYEIETQEELAELLKAAGFSVTQATVSRDIRELRLSKMSDSSQKQKYVLHKKEQEELFEKFARVLKDGLVSLEAAQNILVAKTVSGMAMAVAAAIDAMGLVEVVGTIAGDDTVMMAIRTAQEAAAVRDKLQKMSGR